MSSDSTEGGARVRASDAEREEYARAVREAVGEGRLTLDEGDERLATIYAARFRDELRPVVADLPREEGWAPRGYGWRGAPGSQGRPGPRGPGGAPGAPGDPHRGHYRGGWGFVRPGVVALTVAAALIGIWALSGAHFFWPAIPLTFLAIVLIRRGCWMGRYRRWDGP